MQCGDRRLLCKVGEIEHKAREKKSSSKISIFIGDGYTSDDFEDSLSEIEGIQLVPKRKINLKRQHTQENEKLLRKHRNYIESVFSSIVSRMPRYIRARTEKGFCLKVFFFILAYMVNLFFPLS